MTSENAAMPAFFTDVEKAERVGTGMGDAQHYLARSGGRLACPHPVHRFADVPGSPSQVILPECAGRERWLAARQNGIGGSEVGALIGASEYETPFSVYNTKKRGGKDLSGVAAVEWGHRFEEAVGQATAERVGLTSRFGGGLWAHKQKPHLRVTPDRFATRARSWKAVGIIECKTAGEDGHWQSGTISPKTVSDGAAPLSYQAQIQWQMGLIGLKVGWLGCYVSNQARDFFVVEVRFDPDWFAEMVAEADRFWTENILADEPPLHDLRHPKTEALLKEINPVVVHPSIDLPEGTDEWLETYHRAVLAEKKASRDLDEAKNYFRLMTGDAGAGYLGPRKVVGYPSVNSSRVDVEALKRDYPEIAKKVTVRSTYRRLTISVPKEIKDKISGE